MNLKNNRAFTLIELMIVVAIIGILAASAIPKFAEIINKAKESAAKGNLAALRSTKSIYFADRLVWPAGLDGLVSDYIARLPAAEIPMAKSYDSYKWGENKWTEVNLGVGGDNKGDLNASVIDGASVLGGTGFGWAYYPGEGDIWVDCSVLDTSGKMIHTW